jgi:hypothetical protein
MRKEEIMTEAADAELFPFEHPLHFKVSNLRVISDLNLDGEEGQQEALMDMRVLGAAKLDPRYLALKDGAYLTNELSLSIDSDDYSTIVQSNREIRDKHGEPPRTWIATDTLATAASITHVEREVSELGTVLWDENWHISVTISHDALAGVIESIRLDKANQMTLSLQLKHLRTDESPELTAFWQRDPACLFMEEVSPYGHVCRLNLLHRPEAPVEMQSELPAEGMPKRRYFAAGLIVLLLIGYALISR